MNIAVVDDDALVTLSLKTILEAGGKIKVTATGSSGDEAVEIYKKHKPEVMLMDIRMGDASGLSAAKRILALDPQAKILFLTTFSDDEYIMEAIELGAKGYILKQDFGGIEAALFAAAGGQSVFGSEITARLPQLIHKGGRFDADAAGLSRKEQEIIAEVAKGLSNREIASRLYLSEGTVRNYISSVLMKLGLRDRTQLTVFYFENMK